MTPALIRMRATRRLAAPLPRAPEAPRGARLDGLQAGRAVAALMVVAYHANNFILPLRLTDGAMAWSGFGMGYAGVEFFFVLSGFIMVHVHCRDFGVPGRLGAFAWKRFARIYPIYWLILAGLVVLYQAVGTLGPDLVRDPWVTLSSVLLMPSETRPILAVAWTLKHEVLFYAIFALMILDARLGAAALAGWLGACLLQTVVPFGGFPASFFFSTYNVLFGVGILAAVGAPYLPDRARLPCLVAGAGGVLLVGMTEQFVAPWDFDVRTLSYGLACLIVVTALAGGRWRVPRWAVFLGDASYMIYLVHLPAMNVPAVPLAKLGLAREVPIFVLFAVLTGFAVVAGCALHVLIEKPLLRRLSGRPARRKGDVATPPPDFRQARGRVVPAAPPTVLAEPGNLRRATLLENEQQ